MSARAASLHVTLKRSSTIAAAVVAIHAATLTLIYILSISTAAFAGATVLIVASAALCCWVYALRAGRRGIASIRLRDDRRIEIEQRSGRRVECVIADSTVVGAWVTIIHAYPDYGRPLPWRMKTLLIVPDMLGAEDFRKLRVLLRLGKAEKEPDAAP